MYRLFTPESEIQKKNPPLVMSHVEVPPLRRPKSHYRSYKKIPILSTLSDVQVHQSLQDALQGAFSHNEVVGTIPSPSHSKIVSKKKKPKEKRREENINAVAGPSTRQPHSTVNQNKKRRKDDNDYEGGRKGKKRSRTLHDVDLSLSGDEQVHRKAKPAPSARTRHDAQTDTLLLYLGVIKPVPTPVLAYNTRFLRNFHAKNYGVLPPDEATANAMFGHRYFIPPKIQAQDSEDTISIGDPLTWEEDFQLPVDDDLDDEVVFVGGISKVNVRAPARKLHNPRPPPRPLPPKIDLAAEMWKKQNQNRKKQKDHVSATNSPIKPSPSANYVVATSSSSSTGLLYAENHQHNRNETHPQRDNASNSMPSAKALGKRKATNSDLPEDSFSSRPAPGNPNGPPLILANQPKGLASNVDVFFHTYTRSPSPDPGPTSSTFVPYSNLQPVPSSFYPSSGTSAEPNVQLVDNSAMSKFYRPDLLVNVERSPERFLSETVLDSLEAQSKPSDLWSVLEEETSGQYAFSTIDPTLLGGQLVLPDPEPEFEPPPTLTSEPSSPASHRSKDDDEPYTTTTTDFVPPATNRAARRASSTSSGSAPFRNLPRRLHSKRKMPDMIAIDDLDLDMAGSSSSSSSSGYESSSSSDVGSESSVAKVVSSWPPRVKTVSPVKSKLQEANQSLVLPEPVQFPTWPLGENELYCHQCRNKSRILKMSCSCGKLFCARCITIRCVVHPFFCFLFFFPLLFLSVLDLFIYSGLHRYPPGRFDYAQKQNNNCPYCQGCCNCTACCSKRGEKYVSSGRGRGLGLKSIAKPSPALRRERVSLGGKTNLPPPSQLPSEPVKYWGAVYSLAGKKITSTFAPPTQAGHPAVVFGLPNSEESGVVVKKPKKPLQPKRVFVGIVQRHWGYSKHRRIREFVDKAYALSQKLAIQKQKKKKKHYERHTRWYVGHGARLFWPRKESEHCSLLDDLSPLSSLEDDDEDGQVDEPESLELQAEGQFFHFSFIFVIIDYGDEFLFFRET